MSATLTEQALIGADLVVLLAVDFAGVTWRFSSRPIEVAEAATGTTWRYLGGLEDLELTDEMGLFADTPAIRSVPIHVLWPEDVAQLVADGHDLGSATGELSLLRVGDDLDDRVVFLVGVVSAPEYGESSELVSFSLEENPWDDRGTVLDAGAVVLQDITWTASPDESEGAIDPLVFGQPGPYTLADGTAKKASGSIAVPLWRSGTAYILIADRRTDAGETGANVDIYSAEWDEWVTLPALHLDDLTGRTCTVVDATVQFSRIPPFAGAGAWRPNDTFWCSWTSGAASFRLDAHEPMLGAGDLLEFMLNRSTLRVDRGRVAAAKAYLNQVVVSGYVDIQGAPSDWIKDNLLPILPCVSMTSGPDGIYPCVFRFDSTASNAVANLTEGPEHGLVREGPVAYEGRDALTNEVAFSYALKARTGEFHRTRTISGDPDRVGENDIILSAQARQSHLRYGSRADTLSSDIVYETPSADIVCLWHVLAHGFIRRVVKFSADQRWGWLQKGDVVTVTIPRLHIQDQVGLLRVKRWSLSGFIALEIVLLEDPVRDLRI